MADTIYRYQVGNAAPLYKIAGEHRRDKAYVTEYTAMDMAGKGLAVIIPVNPDRIAHGSSHRRPRKPRIVLNRN